MVVNPLNLIKLSVRELVEFVLRSGSIDSSFKGTSSMQEGVKAHQIIQGKQDDNYEKEVTLKGEIEYKDFKFIIEGRCDGVIKEERITIDEIKSTSKELMFIEEDFNKVHWAQGKVYGYIYAIKNNLPDINVQLTYVNTENYDEKKFLKSFKVEELEEFINELLDKYLELASVKVKLNERRNESISNLEFPFKTYRKGQREMAVKVYKAIDEGKRLYIKAPTGIGKTISTIFPSLKALAEGCIDKIMYLTAKTITRTVAEETFKILRNSGLKSKVLTITAKEKICFNEEVSCNKENCIYADGYYDRVNEGILDIISNEDEINRTTIETYAKKYRLCPFEFSLDISNLVDCVICDYNYVFDPRVSLKRYGEDEYGSYAVLIDEAHNLIDRARGMFSATIDKSKIMEIRKILKYKDKTLYKQLGEINKEFLSIRNSDEEDFSTFKEKPKELITKVNTFITKAENWLSKNQKEEGYKDILELYFSFTSFIRISKLYDERYVTYVTRERSQCIVTLFCLDPSKLLREISKSHKSTVFFSGTLSPLEYYKEVLGGEEKDEILSLKSPYVRENLEIFIYPISTRYRHREFTYSKICNKINMLIEARPGNYLIFFPSYSYMNLTYEEFIKSYSNINTIIQKGDMNEEERENFLSNFNEDSEKTLVGFGVLGGIFSEGIDLKGNRLNGVVVVGVGLPQVCTERNIIKEYYDLKDRDGYDYSYVYPGMNKVMQAAGRVIRTEQDRGTLLLIDDRFISSKYIDLMPYEWLHYKVIK